MTKFKKDRKIHQQTALRLYLFHVLSQETTDQEADDP